MTRAKIAAAAIAQIEKGGANAFSLRNVARSLGVAPTTISSHFRGGLSELEDETVRSVLAGATPPFEPQQAPADYLENMFFSCLKALHGRPMIAMLTIMRLTRNPLVVPRLAERTLACLSALGVAPTAMGAAYRATLQALFALILNGPGRAYLATEGEAAAAAFSPPIPEATEFAYVSKFRQDVLADLLASSSWSPDPKTTAVAVKRLLQELGAG